MEEIKKDLNTAFKGYLEKGISRKEALKKAILDVEKKYPKGVFQKALPSFLEELFSSYKFENLTEVDEFLSFIESLYEEYEILEPKVKLLLKRLKGEN